MCNEIAASIHNGNILGLSNLAGFGFSNGDDSPGIVKRHGFLLNSHRRFPGFYGVGA